MEYAVVESFGKQYLIKPGDTFVVNGTVDEKNITASYAVLLYKNSKLEIGSPTLSTTLPLILKEHKKSDKIQVFTYKAKSRYRKRKGHRQDQTVILWQVKSDASPKATTPKVTNEVKKTKASSKSTNTTKASKTASEKLAKPSSKTSSK